MPRSNHSSAVGVLEEDRVQSGIDVPAPDSELNPAPILPEDLELRVWDVRGAPSL